MEEQCECPPPPPPRIPPEKQTARVAKEKRKKGKVVTTIRGLPAVGNDLPALLTELKDACGAGGTLKEEVIEIQGDQVDGVARVLRQHGYKVRA